MAVLCPCGCGLAARNPEGQPRKGHEAAAKERNKATERLIRLGRSPKVKNGKSERRKRISARRSGEEQPIASPAIVEFV